jgi:hypothetical protein
MTHVRVPNLFKKLTAVHETGKFITCLPKGRVQHDAIRKRPPWVNNVKIFTRLGGYGLGLSEGK